MAALPALTEPQRDAALALARAILPDGARIAGAGTRTVDAAAALMGHVGPRAVAGLGGLARALDAAALLRTGRPFRKLDGEAQQALLGRWQHDPLLRWPLFALGFLYKSVHYDHPAPHQALGVLYERTARAEDARWLRQVQRGEAITADETVECDAVVIGTGAGGAVVGKELAARGHAVVFLEEGDLIRRDEFRGSSIDAHKRLYRGGGAVVAVGNTVIPILMGRLVGGSTAVNAGTCFRTPDWVLEKWCEELGTDELAPEKLAPHFDRVERELRVEPARTEHLGGAARVVARGCDELGWRHFPVRRNAPDCDGQGSCDFGCPTDAKRSTNVSYVPAACDQGAVLYTGVRAKEIWIEDGRAVGVLGRTQGGATLRVRARATIVAGGAIPTPLLLLGQGIANSSGQVGRNLSLHPASAVSALFDEPIRGYAAIPQGYCCDEFHRDGVLLLGASAPVNVGAHMFQLYGRELASAMDDYERMASFGAMIEDESRGRVRRSKSGAPVVTYFMKDEDVARVHRGMVRIAKIFHAAGAKKLFPLVPRMPVLEGEADLKRFREAKLTARDPIMTSFHPLGTCRMGTDPKTSVVDLDHQAHDVPGLFVVDGSAIPGPPAVNPQITIMAFADRAAARISAKLD